MHDKELQMSTRYSAITGNYCLRGRQEEADCVIGFSFGTNITHTGVNSQLASLAIERGLSLWKPVFMERMLTDSLYAYGPQPTFSIEGPITNTRASEGLGTWGVLEAAHRKMREKGLNRPLIVAHAFLAERVATQAETQGMEPVVPEGLPNQFDRDSQQLWTRSRLLWIPREVVGLHVLRQRDQL